jgi:hypothetical protein
MTCVILQPSYIPWRGYFHLIQRADVFVFYDDVHYDKHGWRNRNRIKTPNGLQWLTIPVTADCGRPLHECPINEVRICGHQKWNTKHWKTLVMAYSKAPYFERYAALLEPYYRSSVSSLGEYTISLTKCLARELGLKHTLFLQSSELAARGKKTERLVAILKEVGASHYLSGPTAKDYLDESKLNEAAITLEYMRYDYPEYPQLYPPFEPAVSILDLLFMTGPDAPQYVWGT